MKRKLFIIFLSIVATVCLCLGLSACGEHTHTAADAVIENNVAATCTTDGCYDLVVRCSDCGEIISSKHVVVEAAHTWDDGKVTTAATCTTYGVITYTCTVCGETKTENTATLGHTMVSEVTKEATCAEEGVITYTCSTCGHVHTNKIAKLAHTIEYVEAVAATETSKGNIAHYECTVCGKYFSDSEGTDELLKSYVIIPELSHTHTLEYVAAQAATCTEDGNTEYWYCAGCDKYFSDSAATTETTLAAVTIAASHTLEHVAAQAATCTEDGYNEYWYCTGCGKYFSDSAATTETTLAAVTIAASHTLEYVAPKDATDTDDGNKEYWYCTVCGNYYLDSAATTETDLAGVTITHHTHTTEYVSAVAATCTSTGTTEYYICTECGLMFSDSAATKLLSSEDIITEKTSHSKSRKLAADATCTTDGNVEYWYCSKCGTIFSDSNFTETTLEAVTIPATGHTIEHTEAVAATCTTDGNIEYWYCSVCKTYFSDSEYTIEITLADTVIAGGHNLTHTAAKEATDTQNGNIEYWYCSVCGKYFLDSDGITETTLDATVITAGHTHSITAVAAVAETCTTAGNKEYYVCSDCGMKFSDLAGTTQVSYTDITIPAAGHTYEYSYTDTNASGHYQVCSVCGAKTDTESHTYDSTNTCTVCGYLLENTLYYTLNSDGTSYTVSGIGSLTATDVVIPATYEGLPVTTITDYAFSHNTSITSVTIPASVTKIGYQAFRSCTKLEKVTIGDDVTPASESGYTTIGDCAFLGCTSLKTVYIGNSVTAIPYQMFSSCIALDTISFGSNVTSIGNQAFMGCTAITSMDIPSSVTSIGEYAFQNCDQLTSVTMGTNVTSIGQLAFSYCDVLESVTISLSIEELSYGVFYSCPLLEKVTFVESASGSNLKTIGTIAFYGCTSLQSIEIPASVEIISDNAFYGCSALTTVTLIEDITAGSSLKTIDKQAFAFCTSITDIYLPASVETLGYCAFYGCTSLVSVTGCQGLVTLATSAFNSCSSLKYFASSTEFIIPASVTSICNLVFSHCTAIESITFEDATGWYQTSTENGESEMTLDLTDSAANATYLVTDYKTYYWYKA